MAYRLEANLTLHSMSILTAVESSQDLTQDALYPIIVLLFFLWRRLLTFPLHVRCLNRGWRLFGGGAYSSKYGALFFHKNVLTFGPRLSVLKYFEDFSLKCS